MGVGGRRAVDEASILRERCASGCEGHFFRACVRPALARRMFP